MSMVPPLARPDPTTLAWWAQRRRRREGGSFNPLTAITWYSAFWASDPAWSAPANGAAVSSWRNGGSLGTAATQGAGSSQPTFRSSVAALGNRPAVDFDGTDDRLEITSGVSLAQPFSVVWIGAYDQVATAANTVVSVNSTSNVRIAGTTNASTDYYLNGGGTPLVGGLPVANAGTLVRYYLNGSSSLITANGATQASGALGTAALDQVILGAGRQAPSTYGNHLDGKTAFLGIYSGDISTDPKWESFKAWVRSFYGLSIA